MNIKTVHIIAGFLIVGVFLYTGLYMKTYFPVLYYGNESIRYQFRANHIYILLSGLLNISIGLYHTENFVIWRQKAQFAGSLALLTAPVFLIFAFFNEPIVGVSYRPLTTIGIFLLFGGIALHCISKITKENTMN